ncbi:HlyC/CorC family transporter [Candidatus Sumerlaeota bacterium]|nr:HlyC/CorC family transporter [Candidatus Sumerlaeota bacterium]
MDPEPPEQSKRHFTVSIAALLMIGALFGVAADDVGNQQLMSAFSSPYPPVVLWILLVIFLGLSAFFSGSETALFSLDPIRRSHLEKTHPFGYGFIDRLLEKPYKTLTAILFLNRFANIGATLTAGALSASLVSHSPVVSFLAGAGGVTILILLIGEIMPKTIAIERTQVMALLFAPPLVFFVRISSPFRRMIDFITRLIYRIIRFQSVTKTERYLEEDLKMMLLSGEFDGLLEEDEKEMIDSVFEFADKTAEDIMTPRTDLEAYPNTLNQDEMMEAARKGRYNRVLVYKEDIDHIIGALHVKDILLNPGQNYGDLLREPYFVPPKKNLPSLLLEMQKKRTHIAIVLDEYGGTAGIITLNKLLEEIVGDIQEAREASGKKKDIIRLGTDHYNITGMIDIRELNETLGLNLEEEVSRTLSGFVFNSLGRLPKAGEEFHSSGWHFRILKMDGNRIDRIETRKLPSPHASPVPPEAHEEMKS